MKILFICNQGRNRSRTAAELFASDFKAQSAGLYNDSPVTGQQLVWADLIIVMEDTQRIEIAKSFPAIYLQKRILTLGIPDIYSYRQPELVQLLRAKMSELLQPLI